METAGPFDWEDSSSEQKPLQAATPFCVSSVAITPFGTRLETSPATETSSEASSAVSTEKGIRLQNARVALESAMSRLKKLKKEALDLAFVVLEIEDQLEAAKEKK